MGNKRKLNDWLYIYKISECGCHVLYERSMPRSCVTQADIRVANMRGRGQEAFYTIGATFKGALS